MKMLNEGSKQQHSKKLNMLRQRRFRDRKKEHIVKDLCNVSRRRNYKQSVCPLPFCHKKGHVTRQSIYCQWYRGYFQKALKLYWGGESGLHKFRNLSQFELKAFKAWDATPFQDYYNLSLLRKEFKHPHHVTIEQAAEI
eukprot:scaffold17404_cov35-Attheya_sp.AAC.1